MLAPFTTPRARATSRNPPGPTPENFGHDLYRQINAVPIDEDFRRADRTPKPCAERSGTRVCARGLSRDRHRPHLARPRDNEERGRGRPDPLCGNNTMSQIRPLTTARDERLHLVLRFESEAEQGRDEAITRWPSDQRCFGLVLPSWYATL